jgi:hypothetical protein
MSVGIVLGRTDCMRPVILACFIALAAVTAGADNLGIPLNDLGPRAYRLGYYGGLYENGTNLIPPDHLAAGLERARKIEPRDANGEPSPAGKIGLLTIGNGDTHRVICSQYRAVECEPGSFVSMISNNPRVSSDVVVANAAYESFTTRDLTPVLDDVQRYVLEPAGLTEKQVQVAWLQMSYDRPSVDISCACGDIYNLKIDIGNALRYLQARYPNLQIAYLSSRPFAGYSSSPWNSEPFAYDTGLTMRIMIWVQMEQVRFNASSNDTRVGGIDYTKGQAPWIAWGPYMWANGTTPRSDGLTWQPEDYDGPLLSERGAHKAATLLFNFLMTDPTSRIWFAATGLPSRTRSVRH